MKHRFDDNELKEFLQTETDKHKMFPSDKVWRNIQQEMHGKKQWPALTVIAILIISALTVSTFIYDHPSKTNFQTIPIAALSENIPTPTTSVKAETAKKKLVTQYSISKPIVDVNKMQLNTNNQLAATDFLQVSSNNTTTTEQHTIAVEPIIITEKEIEAIGLTNKKTTIQQTNNVELDKNNVTTVNEFVTANTKSTKVENTLAEKEHTYLVQPNPYLLSQAKKVQQLSKVETESDEFVDEFGFEKAIPVLIKPKKSRFELQVYVAPSISYRKLVDDKTRNGVEPSGGSNGPFAPRYSIDVNDVVRHKPAMGTELGFGILYKINNHIKLKTGVQFNVRKYYIDSYRSGLNIASIAIFRNNVLDTINQFSTLSANNGYAEAQLDNKLFQVSVPIGLEYQVLQGKKLGISVAASLQPTLTLNKNVYLISTDYKYYTDGTSFFRRWNINSSFELNLTYQVGNFNWYLGPQMRFQHLPTYNEKYPIKEYRMDYGLRFGFTKQLFK